MHKRRSARDDARSGGYFTGCPRDGHNDHRCVRYNFSACTRLTAFCNFIESMPFNKIQAEADSNIVPIIHTNARTSPFNAQPTMLWSENDLLNCLFNTYAVMQYRYHTGKITHEKYFEWKLQWSFGSTITHSSPLPKDIDALLQNSNED